VWRVRTLPETHRADTQRLSVNDLIPANTLQLNLAGDTTLPELPRDGRAAYIVFWWRALPLGHQHIPRDALPLQPAQLRNLAIRTITPTVGANALAGGLDAPLSAAPISSSSEKRPLRLQQLLDLTCPLSTLEQVQPAKSDLRVSVVICTRDRPQSVNRCLDSLLQCSPQADEIMVVDNCPSCDATHRVVQQHPQVRYVLEPTPGLDHARNAGIRHSRGQIVAFADDDVTVHPDWVARVADCFVDPQMMAMTGLVLVAELETEAQWLFERYWGFNRGYRAVIYDLQFFQKLKGWGVPVWQIGAGANMAFRRELFDRVGNFDTRLDVGAAGCSGDSELWYRLLAAGLTCRYEPRAVVFHYHRSDMASLRSQLYYYMRGHTTALLIQFEKHRHWGNLLRLFVWLPFFYAKLVVQGIRGRYAGRHRFLLAEWCGCFSGVFYYLRSGRGIRKK
jgi:GT2 family glycosyltransferase